MPATTLLRKQVAPTGIIQPHASGTVPEGFLACDGTIVTIADYPKLFAEIGTSWGYGNNDGLTFHLPDLRGRMLRGQDQGAGRDPNAGTRTAANAGGNVGDNVGTVQGDAIRNLNGYAVTGAEYFGNARGGVFSANSSSGGTRNNGAAGGNVHRVNFNAANTVPTAAENRPINVTVNYIIKAI
jgi:microcystin-dependent protein